jgi:hypothetical protein
VFLDRLRFAVCELGREELAPLWDQHQPDSEREADLEMQSAMADLLAQMTGVRMDPADLEGELTPEKRAKLDAKYGPQIEAAQRASAEAPPPPEPAHQRSRPKASKKELAQKAAQDLLDQDLKKVFKTLVLALHPDRETDEVRRREKEELMKGLIRARDENDYSELLRLHILVSQQDGNDAAPEREVFSESTLKLLTKLLREKCRMLRYALADLQRSHPLLAELRQVTGIPALDQREIQSRAQSLASEVDRVLAGHEAQMAGLPGTPEFFVAYLDRSEAAFADPWDDDGDLHFGSG